MLAVRGLTLMVTENSVELRGNFTVIAMDEQGNTLELREYDLPASTTEAFDDTANWLVEVLSLAAEAGCGPTRSQESDSAKIHYQAEVHTAEEALRILRTTAENTAAKESELHYAIGYARSSLEGLLGALGELK